MTTLDRIKEKIKYEIRAEQFEKCSEAIASANVNMLNFLSGFTIVFSLFFCIYSYLNESEQYLYKYIYTIFFGLSLAFWHIVRLAYKKTMRTVFWYVLFYEIMIYAYFVVINIFYQRDTCISSYYIILLLSFCFLIKPIQFLLIQTIETILMCVLICMFKTPECVQIDVINAILVWFFGTFTGCIVMRFRQISMQKLEEKRQALNLVSLYQGILDETKTATYAYDVSNYEVIFKNREAKRAFEGKNLWELWDIGKENLGEIYVDGRYYSSKDKVIDWNGRTAKVVYLTDITDTKKMAEQMRAAHEELQKKYQEEMLYRAKAVSEDVLATSRLNLTKGIVEEMRVGNVEGYEKEYRYTIRFVERIATFTKDVWLTNEQNKRLSREELLASFEKGETSFTEEYMAQLKDERHVWVRVEVNLLKRPETSEVMAFIYNRDITQEQKLKHIVECVMSFGYDEIYTLDIECARFVAVAMGQYALENQKSKGWYEDELQCLIDRALLEEDKEKIRNEMTLEGLQKNMAEEPMHVVEVSLLSRNGKSRRKQIRCMYLNQEMGSVLITLTDIEDVVKAEKKKQEELERALAMAEEANTSKSNFLASMSHEIRTPMNAIIGLNSIIKDNIENKAQVLDCTEKLDSASRFLLALLNDILDMSRIDSGNMVLVHQPFDGAKFWDNVNILAKAQADAASIHYVFEREKAILGAYIGDATRMQQIMINLINNAIKFTPADGYVKVSVIEKELSEQQAEINVIVKDTGIGISKEFLPKLFEIFTQEHVGNNTSYQGSGLGLSIARNIARLMHGDITVESTVGEGTTFFVKLILDVNKEETKEAVRECARDIDFSGKKILLAEDHPLNTLVAKKLLTKKGFQVVHAGHGKKALELFEQSNLYEYDAILMDIRMPQMDGIKATKRIRALQRADAKTIPIIAMTANAYEEDRKSTKNAGMNAHLAKPIDPQELFETLDKFVHNF